MAEEHSTPPSQTVGIGEMKSGRRNGSLHAHALGSCVGLVLFDPKVRVGVLLHYQLPRPRQLGGDNPLLYGETGIPRAVQEALQLGAIKRHLVAALLGGGDMLQQPGAESKSQHIGTENLRMARKLLWQETIFIKYEDVGGELARSVQLDLETSLLSVRHPNGESNVWDFNS